MKYTSPKYARVVICVFYIGDPDYDARSTMAEQQQHAAAPRNAVKLPPFWVENSAAWFRNADGQFFLNNVNDELVKYYNALNALPESVVNKIADFVEAELPEDPYTQLRRRLVTVHELSNYQRVDMLAKLPPIGDQKPSELLAEMVRICPRGEEQSVFFIYMFLNRLPRDIRSHLSGMDMGNRAALAARADELWTHRPHTGQVHAIEEDDGEVNAIRGGVPRGARKQPTAGGGGGNKRPPKKAGNLTRAEEEEMKASGLCFYHFRYAEDARLCRKPCAWQGN